MKRKFLLFRSVLLTLLLLLGAQGATAANYLTGDWDSWGNAYSTDGSGNVSIELAASTSYYFKLHDTGVSGHDDNWYGNSGTMTSTNCTNWTFTNPGDNARITTTAAGTYTFHVSWSGSTPTISVTYPSGPVAADYYLKHNWNNAGWTWQGPLTANGDGTYSFVRKYGGTGCDWNTSASDAGSTYVAVPTLVGSPANGDDCTFTFDPTAGSITITKVGVASTTYNMVVGSVEQTENTTGLFTVDLQSATENKDVSFKIDGVAYKLEGEAATISAAGTTNYTVKTETATVKEFLTLTKGLIYYFTILSDGRVSVRAVEPVAPVLGGFSYYLVGNFMDTDGNTISEENRKDRKFRFFRNTDGTYYFDMSATLKVKSQIVAVSPAGVATVYGPSAGNQTFEIANDGYATYALGANSNEFYADDRGLSSSGMYRYTITVGANGTPTSVTVSHIWDTLVAFYWPEATTTSPSPTAQPTYTVRKSDGGSDNRYFGNVSLEDGQHCWVLGNFQKDAKNDMPGSPLYTTTRLYKQGNGGGNVITRKKDDGSNAPDGVDFTHVYPYWIRQSGDDDIYKANLTGRGFTFGGGAAYTLEYNPSKGTFEVKNRSGNDGIGGEVLRAGFGPLAEPIRTISVIGPGIPASGSWDIATKQAMTYNQQLQCYEYTFTKTTSESNTEHFRFVANDNWNMNWEENSTDAADKARVPYRSTNAGHSAMVDDPNYIKRGYATDASGSARADEGSHDIILNRPEGKWTIRFYIKTSPDPTNSGNYLVDYYYTIDGSPSKGFDIPVYGGRVLCSFSSSKSLNIPDGYRAYVAHRFTTKVEGSDNTKDGKVDLYRIKYIPKNVGVILYGEHSQPNGTNVTVPFTEYTETEKEGNALWWYQTEHENEGETFNNYLVAAPDGTVLSTNGLLDTSPEYYDKETHTYKYYVYKSRYFAFTWFSKTLYANYYDWTSYPSAPKTGTLKAESTAGTGLVFPTAITDYASFYRAAGAVGKNRAYLDLPAEVMGYSGQALSQNQDEDPQLFAKSGLRFEDFYYEDYSDEFSTAIQPIVNVANGNMDNTFYNIQGMKVANPTKGLYIINGKKMIVK